MSVSLGKTSAKLSRLKSGNLTADGTEQTLVEFSEVGKMSGYVDLGNLCVGDIVVIRQYMKIVEGGSYRKYADEAFSGPQANPILYFTPKENDLAIKITLQQATGVLRGFPHNFIKEV